ncbi:hypothetical protein MA4S0726RB_3939 [Mycobacteroides abscessus 4S-0726-RB]|nr:hypothetical protein MA4S0303_4409 [Mycobacteroides abscessus 4S-0303]EIT92603.1 hypothetical protein MA4S0726RB_3939 [Mycobacteroides abscessus 4S-0726-RB]EIT96151.1 hypothetical protein MA4S0726RA_4348 [Mycobacteroides abscessus 4S-0726-RA]EIV20535.1 hypothetical protein MA3A0119R_4824 [Mycobacteroides abscessus 3A-0119-R]EIV60583.1 hypothetical protein MA4S0116S_3485 [Mycobacteroides abscessus 4S-0116-S]ETZ63067.1 hypothetical protein L836_4506 [Mycobacteroides abscessus MAB_110811_2726]
MRVPESLAPRNLVGDLFVVWTDRVKPYDGLSVTPFHAEGHQR